MYSSLKSRAASFALLFIISISFSPVTFAQSPERIDFNIGGSKYYLHRIGYQEQTASIAEMKKCAFNQNMIADDRYIYLVDYANNTSDNITIKRYDAINCTRADDLVINPDDIDEYGINKLSNDERCFYLVDCDEDTEHLMLFPYFSIDGVPAYAFSYVFYLIDKTGNIIREFSIRNKPVINDTTKDISDMGVPVVMGNPSQGNFKVLFPFNEYSGGIVASLANFENNSLKNLVNKYSKLDTSSAKPSICLVDDAYFIMDDKDTTPSLFSYNNFNFNPISALDAGIDVRANGCKVLSFDGHRMLLTAGLSQDDTSYTTHCKIGLWDAAAKPQSRADNEPDFSSYTPLASVEFGNSNYTATEQLPYAYRQFIAESDFGNGVKHLHFYEPGNFLATYQLNKNDQITGAIGITTDVSRQDVDYSIHNGVIVFDQPVDNVRIFNLSGCMIFNSCCQVKSINLTKFAKGVYIVNVNNNTFKINL